MKVYVAGSSAEMERAEKQMAALRAAGIEVVSSWPEVIRKVGSANPMEASREERAEWASTDLLEVCSADTLWLLLPEIKRSEGACVEFGFGIMLRRIAEMAHANGHTNCPEFFMICSGKETSIFTALAFHCGTDADARYVLEQRHALQMGASVAR